MKAWYLLQRGAGHNQSIHNTHNPPPEIPQLTCSYSTLDLQWRYTLITPNTPTPTVTTPFWRPIFPLVVVAALKLHCNSETGVFWKGVERKFTLPCEGGSYRGQGVDVMSLGLKTFQHYEVGGGGVCKFLSKDFKF